jgi:DNA-binding NtrC family response regulator
MSRILIVDDNINLRGILRQILESAGHQVREASNGVEAMKVLSEGPAELVITDVIMPDKEGIETVIEIRKIFPDMKIIVMSAGGRFGPEDYLETATVFGANRTIAKPFSRNDILKTVQELIGQSSTSGATV